MDKKKDNNKNTDYKNKSLSNRAISGMKWVMGLRLARRSISMIKNIILARLLLPSDFGLLGVALYHNQVKAYIETFRDCRFFLYDDLKHDAEKLVNGMFAFLGINNDFLPNVNVKNNNSGISRNKVINDFFTKPNFVKKTLKPIVRMFLSEEKKREIVRAIKNKNYTSSGMNPETRQYLIDFFRGDVLKLQDLIKRDLSHRLQQED